MACDSSSQASTRIYSPSNTGTEETRRGILSLAQCRTAADAMLFCKVGIVEWASTNQYPRTL